MQTNTAPVVDGVNDLDEGYLSEEELVSALEVYPGKGLQPGDFGYETYVATPARTRNRCVDSHLIPEGAWGIFLFEDDSLRSYETVEGTKFSERGKAWFDHLKSTTPLPRVTAVSSTYEDNYSYSYSNDNWDYTAIK